MKEAFLLLASLGFLTFGVWPIEAGDGFLLLVSRGLVITASLFIGGLWLDLRNERKTRRKLVQSPKAVRAVMLRGAQERNAALVAGMRKRRLHESKPECET